MRPLSVSLAYALAASRSLQLPRHSAGLPDDLLLFSPLRCRFWVTGSWLAALVLTRAYSLRAISVWPAPSDFEAMPLRNALRLRPQTLQASCVPPRWVAAGPGAAVGASDGSLRPPS